MLKLSRTHVVEPLPSIAPKRLPAKRPIALGAAVVIPVATMESASGEFSIGRVKPTASASVRAPQ